MFQLKLLRFFTWHRAGLYRRADQLYFIIPHVNKTKYEETVVSQDCGLWREAKREENQGVPQ